MPPKVHAPWNLALRLATLAAAIGLAAHAAGFDNGCLLQAQVWLPSGVATAGVLLLGWRAVPVVFATNALLRLMWSSDPTLALANGLGSSSEAMLGAWLMRRFGAARGSASLRSLLGLYLAAAVAPAASVLLGWLFRLGDYPSGAQFADTAPGWWRMNAIGILLVLPLAQAWQRSPGSRLRRTPEILGAVATIVVIIAALLAFTTPSIPAVLLLGSVVFVVLGAALRTGELGGSIAALAASIAIATPTGYGIGPLTCVPLEQRHVAAQLLLGSIAATLPLFLALLSERDTNSARWLQTRELGRALLQLLPDTTYRVAADGTILDRAVSGGVTPDIDRHLSGAAGTALGEALRGELQRALAGGAGEPFEFVAETAQGPREFEARFVPLPNAEALAIVRDISVRRRAEQLVRLQARILQMIATGQRRQDILLALVEGLEMLIPDGRCSVLLRHGQRLFVACGPSMPDSYNALIDGLEIGPFQGACGTAAATNDNVICADLQTDPNWAAYRDLARRFGINACWSVPARSARGEVVGTFAVYHDVPRHPTPFEIEAVERAAMLAGLAIERERREALLRSTWQNVREGLFRSIPGEGFTYVNTAFARMFGYTDEQQLLHEWRNGTPRHRDCLLMLVEETLSISDREVSMLRRDGTEFWAKVTTRISFEDGDAELICDGTVVDISANRELQEQLRHSQKMEAVGLLTGGVAHDFNNLLTAITVSADALLSQLPDDTPARRDAEHVLAAARRAADLTRRLLAFGRRQPQSTEVSDLARIVDDVATLLRRLLGSGVELVHERGPTAARARIDRGEVEQVIVNLAINARDAMPDGGRITIATDVVTVTADAPAPAGLVPGRYARVRVTDDGTGMTPEVLARARDPFFTTKPPEHGTGLGLSTVAAIVQKSRGTLEIDSAPGRGTTVTAYLPFAKELPSGEKDVLLPRPQQRRRRILVVEDEPIVLELAARALRAAGHEVVTVTGGDAALAALEAAAGAFDAVVSDVIMPRMSGFQLGRKVLARWPALKLLMMSGYAEDAADRDRDLAAAGFLSKPFTTSELIARVDELFDHSDRAATPSTPHA